MLLTHYVRPGAGEGSGGPGGLSAGARLYFGSMGPLAPALPNSPSHLRPPSSLFQASVSLPALQIDGHAGSQERTKCNRYMGRKSGWDSGGWGPGTEPPERTCPTQSPCSLLATAPVQGEAGSSTSGGDGRTETPSDLLRAGVRIHGKKWPHVGDLLLRGWLLPKPRIISLGVHLPFRRTGVGA